MAPEISHILFIGTYFDFMFLLKLPILKVLYVQLEWLKCLNFEGTLFWCSKCQILSFFHICLLAYLKL